MHDAAAARQLEYKSFPNVPARNGLQASIEVPALISALRLPRGGRILEIGCGRGIALPVFHSLLRPERLVGLDIDPELVAAAVDYVDGLPIEVVHGDARDLPFEDNSFDLVVDFGTCYHIDDPASAMREVGRVLRERGMFVHETPVSQHLAHPIRSLGRTLPWRQVRELQRFRTALLWSVRTKVSTRATRRRGATLRETQQVVEDAGGGHGWSSPRPGDDQRIVAIPLRREDERVVGSLERAERAVGSD
jgi:SAM-dependent methyltransferase